MSHATRDQRATIYPYLGRVDGGYVTSAYGYARGTFWCRVSPAPGAEAMLDAQSGILARATIEFADEVPVQEHDLIVIDGVQWKAGPITARKLQRALMLQVERSTETEELLTGQAEPEADEVFVESGHTDEGYSAPGDESIDGGNASTTTFSETLDGGGA
jgi:hypothetical protein